MRNRIALTHRTCLQAVDSTRKLPKGRSDQRGKQLEATAKREAPRRRYRAGFLPGRSGNPRGRPRSTGLLEELRENIFEVGPDGRTVAQLIAEMLVDESLHGRQRIAAASLILDRLEGRPPQQLDLKNITPDFSNRSDEELRFYLEHSRWPEERELPAAPNEKSNTPTQ